MNPLITIGQLLEFPDAPELDPIRVGNLVTSFNHLCPKYGITDAEGFREVFSMMAIKSNFFTELEENLDYQNPQRLLQLWPDDFKTIPDAMGYTENPRALAEKVYMGKFGNFIKGDGYRFRGRGFIKLVGRDSYQSYSNYKDISISDTIYRLSESDGYNVDVSLWLYKYSAMDMNLQAEDFLSMFELTKQIIN